MNNYARVILLGLIIWAIPFVTSFFVWDPVAEVPTVSDAWFNAIMSVTFAIGLALAIILYFKNKKADPMQAGWIWYVELVILDLAVLVYALGMAMADYYALAATYLMVPIIMCAIKKVRK